MLRILNGQIAKEHGVDQGENRGVGANAEGENEDGDGSEARRFAQHPQGVAQVLNQGFKEMRALRFADFFLELLVAAELNSSTSLRLCTRNARALKIIGAILDVRAQLLFQFVLDQGTVEQRRNDRTKRGEDPHISSGCALSAEAIAATRRFQPSSSWRKRFRPAVVSS